MLRRKAEGITGREIHRPDDPGGGRNRRQQDAQKPGEGDRDRRDGSGLDHQEQRPAVEKTPERAVGFAQINVLSARSRHHGGQFAVAQGADEGERAGEEPHDQEPAGRTDLPRNVRRNDEDARPDHRAGDNHDGIQQAKPLNEFIVRAGGGSRVWHGLAGQGLSADGRIKPSGIGCWKLNVGCFSASAFSLQPSSRWLTISRRFDSLSPVRM